jgi:Mrp family chromosome partitioning ATPase
MKNDDDTQILWKDSVAVEKGHESDNDQPEEMNTSTEDGESIVASGRALIPASLRGNKRALVPAEQRNRLLLDPEIIKLFYTVDALKEDDKSFVLQFLASTPGEGTTTISWGFALAASYEYATPTLIIDCSSEERESDSRPSLVDAFIQSGQLDAAITKVPGTARLYYARLSTNVSPMLEIDAADLRELFEFLKLDFSGVVLDCPAASNVTDSLALSRYADGSIVVVKSGQARRGVIEWTHNSIGQFGGICLGTVFNYREKRIPDWLYRLI